MCECLCALIGNVSGKTCCDNIFKRIVLDAVTVVFQVCPFQGSGDTHTEAEANKVRFREFVVFNQALIYPEYLIAYDRQ